MLPEYSHAPNRSTHGNDLDSDIDAYDASIQAAANKLAADEAAYAIQSATLMNQVNAGTLDFDTAVQQLAEWDQARHITTTERHKQDEKVDQKPHVDLTGNEIGGDFNRTDPSNLFTRDESASNNKDTTLSSEVGDKTKTQTDSADKLSGDEVRLGLIALAALGDSGALITPNLSTGGGAFIDDLIGLNRDNSVIYHRKIAEVEHKKHRTAAQAQNIIARAQAAKQRARVQAQMNERRRNFGY